MNCKKIVNPIIRSLVKRLVEELGKLERPHPKNPDTLLNIRDPIKGVNIMGDIRTLSKDGSFRVRGKDGRFQAYWKLGFDLKDPQFEEKMIAYLFNQG